MNHEPRLLVFVAGDAVAGAIVCTALKLVAAVIVVALAIAR